MDGDTRTFIPFLDTIEKDCLELPDHIVADAGYGSEQNYDDILKNRKRIPLITYNQYQKEKKGNLKTTLLIRPIGHMTWRTTLLLVRTDKVFY